jgi:hypothetical protein
MANTKRTPAPPPAPQGDQWYGEGGPSGGSDVLDPNGPYVGSDIPPPTTDTTTPSTSTLRSLTQEELDKLLAAIGARYNVTEQQLLANQSQIGLAARSLALQLGQEQRRSVAAARNSALERGLLRSGLHAKNVAQIDTAIASEAQTGAQSTQAKLDAIKTAIAMLESQMKAEQAKATEDVKNNLIQFEQGQNINDLIASMPPAPNPLPGVQIDPMPYIPAPVLPSAPTWADLFAGLYNGNLPYGSIYPDNGPTTTTTSGDNFLNYLTPDDLAAYLATQGG